MGVPAAGMHQADITGWDIYSNPSVNQLPFTGEKNDTQLVAASQV